MIRERRILALCLTGLLALAACSGTATPTPTTAATGTPGAGATATPAPSATPVTATLNFGFATAADPSHLPTLLGIQEMNAAGWKISPTFFDTPETDIAALASGQVPIAVGAPVSMLTAIQAGAKIHIIAAEQGTAWDVVAVNAIAKCDDLVGKVWALNSAGGATTSYANYWLQNNCSADSQSKIKPIYISGSETRAAAMIAGRVDATLLTPFDIVNLNAQAAGKFHTVADFGSDPSLKNYKSSVFGVNDDFAAAHPDVVVAFLKGMIKAYGDASKDVTVLGPAAQANNLTFDTGTQQALGLMFSGGVYDTGLALTDSSVSFIVQFSQKYGALNPGLTTSQVANFTFLQQASAP
jgi:ABC-type nitrate/sulfonate/bicarbonate transport system substrate-binding protein